MAERRMFAKAVIGSGKFLRMPATARLLYYDLGMEADDDGFVEAFRVMRTTGATDDDLKILCAKGFVRVMNDELVTLITDWNVNNYIQRDRYHKSVYADLLNSVDTTCIQPVYNMDTSGIPTVSKPDTEVRVGKSKVSSGQYRGDESVPADADAHATRAAKKAEKKFVPPTVDEVAAYCKEKGIVTVDPEHFIEYYTENEWKKQNGEPVLNWKSTVLTWARRDKERGYTAKPVAKSSAPAASSFDTDEFVDAAIKASYSRMDAQPVEVLPERVDRDYSALWAKIM